MSSESLMSSCERWVFMLYRSAETKSLGLCSLQILEDEIQADFYVAVPAIMPKLIPLRNKLKRKYPTTRRSKQQLPVTAGTSAWRGWSPGAAPAVFSDEDVELHSALGCRGLHHLP